MSALTIDRLAVPVRVPSRPTGTAVVIPFPTPPVRRRPAPPPRLHVTRRGRLTVTVLVALAVSVAAVAVLAPASPSPPRWGTGVMRPTDTATTEVVVTPGETLWGIAAAVAAPDEDVRDVIAEIREMNSLESSGLVVGQELVVPSR